MLFWAVRLFRWTSDASLITRHLQFAIGWWLWVDANVYSNKFEQTDIKVTFGHYVPGIVSTLGLIMSCSFPLSPLPYRIVIG